MITNIKYFLLSVACVAFLNASTKDSDFLLTDVTLVVGNRRIPGGVQSPLAEFVDQKNGDFTHTKSFGGKVISIDVSPVSGLFKACHKQIDFVSSTPEFLMEKINKDYISCVFFEWFPSSKETTHFCYLQ